MKKRKGNPASGQRREEVGMGGAGEEINQLISRLQNLRN